MSALREILASFDIIVNSEQLEAGTAKLDSFVDKLKAVGTALAGFALVKSIVSFGEHVTEAARAVEFHAGRMEMDTNEYQRLSQVAANYGMTMEQLQIANTLFTRALSGMGGTMGTFSDRTGQAREAMRALGLDAKQFKGQRLEQILPVISDAMLKITDPMERVAIGLRLFGHRGRAIMPLMAVGGDELRRQLAAAVPVFEEATIKTADRAAVSGKNLGRVWDNLIYNSFGKALLSAMDSTARYLTNVLVVLKDVIKNSEIGQATLIALGVAMAVAAAVAIVVWWPVLAPILAIVAAFAALAVIIDDVIVFMEGGKSVLGEFFDDLLGKGGAEAARKKIKEVWDDVKAFFGWVHGEKVDWHRFFDTTTLEAIQLILDKIKAALLWIGNGELAALKGAGNWLGNLFTPTPGGQPLSPEKHAALVAAVAQAAAEGRNYVVTGQAPAIHPAIGPQTADGANAGTGAMLSPAYIHIDARGAEPGVVHHEVKKALHEHTGRQHRDAMAGAGGSK